MIALSVVVGIPTNLGFISLFGLEILGPLSILKAGRGLSTHVLLFGSILLILHILLISMVFLTKQRYFRSMMIWVPLFFVIFFTIYNFWSLPLLVPFIIVWLIAIFRDRKSSQIALTSSSAQLNKPTNPPFPDY